MDKKQKLKLIRIIISAVIFAAVFIIPMGDVLRTVLSLTAYIVVGYEVLLGAFFGIIHGRVFDENFLMAVATIGAIVLGFTSKSYEFTEAIAVMALFETGELFQDFAVNRTRRSISALFEIRPDTAICLRGEEELTVPSEEIEVGESVVVYPGARIPLDGVIVSGESQIDNSALTGESLPVYVKDGDRVLSGGINLSGVIVVRVTAAFSQSTASKILALVEESSMKKSRQENFIKRFAKVYTPIVCGCALCLGVMPPIINIIMKNPAEWSDWVYRALNFLVISCPCALVISVPLTFFAGLGAGGKKGILIKGANYLDALSRVDTVVFDKTGTITTGELEVKNIKAIGVSSEELLYLAAHVEYPLTHPLARAIVRSFGKEIDKQAVQDLKVYAGKGASATVGEKNVVLGNQRLLEEHGIASEDGDETSVYVGIDGVYCGRITFTDTVKPGAKEGLAALKGQGVKSLVMLTGDKEAPAKEFASDLGFDSYKSQLLPEDKVSELEKILAASTGGKVLFVGDGVNDAPALSRADVGIAMGGAGSDGAIESSDVVIMDDDIKKIGLSVKIARKCINIVTENIVFALAVKGVCLVLSALNLTAMWVAIFADVGVMIIAVLNAIRALFIKE